MTPRLPARLRIDKMIMAEPTSTIGQLLMRSPFDRVVWYFTRLSAMTPAEIAYRLIEASKKQVGRLHNKRWVSVKPVGPLASLPDGMISTHACQPKFDELIAAEANDVRAGYFHLLGACWPEPSSMPPAPHFWHFDPDDGELFPQRHAYCFDVSFRHGVGTREIKRIWELNRLQFIVPLAFDAAIKNDRQSMDLVVGLIQSWMEGNPPYRGPNWVSGIELALRVISIAVALSVIGIEHLDATARNAALQFFFAHVNWIKRFPSKYSSANNHRIAELVGLIIGTIMAPEIRGAAAIREDSWQALLIELERQIHPDGVGAEQSPGYTAFSIELFLLAAIAYKREHRLPAAITDRLLAWTEHSLWLMDANAQIPAIGDFDDCRAIATTQAPEPRYVASLVGVVSSFVGRPDLAPPAKDPSLRDLVLGSAGVSLSNRTGTRSFPMGGYSIIRHTDKIPVVLTFDHGPVGYLSIAAHGHADALAVWLSIGSYPVIIDAGTYLYHSDRTLRNRFRASAAHNTLTLDGISSSRPSGLFNWANKANSLLISFESNPVPRIVAEHDGYVRQYGIRHRRSVEFDNSSRFTIIDEIPGIPKEGRTVTVSFLLDSACKSTLEPDRGSVLITREHRPIARILNMGPLETKIVRGDVQTSLGWMSPLFGVRVPTDQIVFEGCLNKPSTIIIDVL